MCIVIATVAFGMGVDCPDVHQVISLGSPSNWESYVQETGCAGCHNKPSFAALIKKASTGRYIERTMLEYLSNKLCCQRDNLMITNIHFLDHCVYVVMYA